MEITRKARCLTIDIETSPSLAYVWDTRDQNIAANQIVKDWHIMAYSARWLGEKKMMYADVRSTWHKWDDKRLVRDLWKLLDEADIVIGQNSKGFDTKKIAARIQFHQMLPPSPYKHLDTYLIAKTSGAFTKNSLEYLSKYLGCKHHKLEHSDFPGQVLWNECLLGNPKAWDTMEEYNNNDVVVAEEMYEKLAPWAPKNAPRVFELGCDQCGRGMAKNGIRAGMQLFRCTGCGRATSTKIKLLKAA